MIKLIDIINEVKVERVKGFYDMVEDCIKEHGLFITMIIISKDQGAIKDLIDDNADDTELINSTNIFINYFKPYNNIAEKILIEVANEDGTNLELKYFYKFCQLVGDEDGYVIFHNHNKILTIE